MTLSVSYTGEVSRMTRSQIVRLQRRAEADEADAQLRLGMAYEKRFQLLHLTSAQGRNEALVSFVDGEEKAIHWHSGCSPLISIQAKHTNGT